MARDLLYQAQQVIAWKAAAQASRAAVQPLDAWSRAEGLDNPSEDAADRDLANFHRWCIDAAPELAALTVKVERATREPPHIKEMPASRDHTSYEQGWAYAMEWMRQHLGLSGGG